MIRTMPVFLAVLWLLAAGPWLAACRGPAVPPAPTLMASPAPQPSPPPTATPTPAPTATPSLSRNLSLWEDFEGTGPTWDAGQAPSYSDSDAQAAEVTTEHASQGSHALRLTFDLQSADRKAIFYTEGDLDLSAVERVLVDAYNPGEPLKLALALSTGGAWEWHESVPITLKKGWNHDLAFNLRAPSWKAARTNWEFATTPANLPVTKRLALLLFVSRPGPGTLFVDNIRFEIGGRVVEETAAPPVTPMPPRLLAVQPSAATPPRYAFLELEVALEATFSNPFDPEQVDLSATFTSPSGDSISIPGFYFQDFESWMVNGQEVLTPVGEPGWRIRFTPSEVGQWHYTVRLSTADGADETTLLSFEVTPSEAHGFVRVSPDDPAYLAFEDSTPFFGIGLNLGWYGPAGTQDYAHWFQQVHATGANLARIWMPSWSMGIEWNDTGLGDYTGRLDRAWQLDRVLQLAEEHGIYLILVLLNHGPFSLTYNSEWAANPYNAANGGPCASPQDFLTDPRARLLFQRRLRYIAARWGYSPHLLALEWWNEVDLTPASGDALAPWLEEMDAYLDTMAPYPHLSTISYAHRWDDRVFRLPQIALVQKHEYSKADPALTIPRLTKDLRAFGKPAFYGEYGLSTSEENVSSLDRTGVHLHRALWAGLMSKGAIAPLYWWWDTYMEPLDLYRHFTGLAAFLKDEDLIAPGYMPVTVATDSPGVQGLTLQSPTRILLWVCSSHCTYSAIEQQYEQALRKALKAGSSPPTDFQPAFPPVRGVTLTVNVPDDAYQVEWWDPLAGVIVERGSAQAVGGVLRLSPPPFSCDLAAKVWAAE
ncbi:MAG: hypothetical protein CVU38_07735 [Chloroflexi bacterium HGW-Chloroflexi-1]|nr:MAG: hypothetical protein CVU38_07735 [Chloroflexi bacterium HGW-Chloroflexi-1]